MDREVPAFSYVGLSKLALEKAGIIKDDVLIIGSVSELSIVWDIADTLNGLMAIPNFIAVFAHNSLNLTGNDSLNSICFSDDHKLPHVLEPQIGKTHSILLR